MSRPQPDLLAVVERSPRAVAAHDRAGWVGLFTSDARVQDPVGSWPHVGHRRIGRFYDTFIGPRDIVFRRDLDISAGPTVVLSITTTQGRGVLFADVARRGDEIHRVRYFPA